MFVICCFLRSCLPSSIFRWWSLQTHTPVSTASLASCQQKLSFYKNVYLFHLYCRTKKKFLLFSANRSQLCPIGPRTESTSTLRQFFRFESVFFKCVYLMCISWWANVHLVILIFSSAVMSLLDDWVTDTLSSHLQSFFL